MSKKEWRGKGEKEMAKTKNSMTLIYSRYDKRKWLRRRIVWLSYTRGMIKGSGYDEE